jgi:transposase
MQGVNIKGQDLLSSGYRPVSRPDNRARAMSDVFWLTDAQMARLFPFFPRSHGKPHVDDRRVLSWIIFINRNVLRWRGAPKTYGPHKTFYGRWRRWSDKAVFARMMPGLAVEHSEKMIAIIDAPTSRPIGQCQYGHEEGGRGRLIGRNKIMSTKRHAICDSQGQPLDLLLTAGHASGTIGARALPSSLPKVNRLLGGPGQ